MFVQNQFIQISINDKQQAIYIKNNNNKTVECENISKFGCTQTCAFFLRQGHFIDKEYDIRCQWTCFMWLLIYKILHI